jgi:hypothetical protein
MRVHLVNPSNESFGVALMTPRWLYVLAAATPRWYGDPILIDEMLEPCNPMRIAPGDVVGIGIHTGNALRGYEIGQQARERGATVVFGGIHATLYSDEAHDRGRAHAVVKGDGDQVWPACSPTVKLGGSSASTRAAVSALAHSYRRAGTCFRHDGTCGRPSRQSEVAPSTVRFARCGGPMDSSRGSVLSITY